MVRPLDVATQGAIRDRSRVIPRNFIAVTVRKLTSDDPVTFGFTDYGEDIVTNIIDGETGAATSWIFLGDNGPVLGLDPVPYKIGVEVDTTEVVLNHLHPGVQDMVRGHNCRNAKVQIHRGYLDPVSMLLVAAPRCRRLGQINGTPIVTPGLGGEGSITLRIVSKTRELTRTNPVKASAEFYQRRSNDQWGRYAGTAGQWPIWWGEDKGTTV
jgi:hypothetical protein